MSFPNPTPATPVNGLADTYGTNRSLVNGFAPAAASKGRGGKNLDCKEFESLKIALTETACVMDTTDFEKYISVINKLDESDKELIRTELSAIERLLLIHNKNNRNNTDIKDAIIDVGRQVQACFTEIEKKTKISIPTLFHPSRYVLTLAMKSMVIYRQQSEARDAIIARTAWTFIDKRFPDVQSGDDRDYIFTRLCKHVCPIHAARIASANLSVKPEFTRDVTAQELDDFKEAVALKLTSSAITAQMSWSLDQKRNTIFKRFSEELPLESVTAVNMMNYNKGVFYRELIRDVTEPLAELTGKTQDAITGEVFKLVPTETSKGAAADKGSVVSIKLPKPCRLQYVSEITPHINDILGTPITQNTIINYTPNDTNSKIYVCRFQNGQYKVRMFSPQNNKWLYSPITTLHIGKLIALNACDWNQLSKETRLDMLRCACANPDSNQNFSQVISITDIIENNTWPADAFKSECFEIIHRYCVVSDEYTEHAITVWAVESRCGSDTQWAKKATDFTQRMRLKEADKHVAAIEKLEKKYTNKYANQTDRLKDCNGKIAKRRVLVIAALEGDLDAVKTFLELYRPPKAIRTEIKKEEIEAHKAKHFWQDLLMPIIEFFDFESTDERPATQQEKLDRQRRINERLTVRDKRKLLVDKYLLRTDRLALSLINMPEFESRDFKSIVLLAALNGHHEVVDYLLGHPHIYLKRNSNYGRNLWHLACCCDDDSTKVLEVLEKHKAILNRDGCMINDKDKLGNSAIHMACVDGKLNVIDWLIQHAGPEIMNTPCTDIQVLADSQAYEHKSKHKNGKKRTAALKEADDLYYKPVTRFADICEQQKLAEKARDNGNQTYKPDDLSLPSGGYPIHCACEGRHHNVVEYLLEKNSSLVRQQDNWGRTALHVALSKEDTETASHIIRHALKNNMYDIFAICDKNGNNPIHLAAGVSGMSSLITLMFRDVNSAEYHQYARAQQTAAQAQPKAWTPRVKYLHAAMTACNKRKMTPLKNALRSDNEEAACELIGLGAAIEPCHGLSSDDRPGDSLLTQLLKITEPAHQPHDGSYKFDQVIITLCQRYPHLLKVTTGEPLLRSPLHFCCMSGRIRLLKALLEIDKELDFNQPDGYGNSAVLLACRAKQWDVINTLTNHFPADGTVKLDFMLANKYGENPCGLLVQHEINTAGDSPDYQALQAVIDSVLQYTVTASGNAHPPMLEKKLTRQPPVSADETDGSSKKSLQFLNVMSKVTKSPLTQTAAKIGSLTLLKQVHGGSSDYKETITQHFPDTAAEAEVAEPETYEWVEIDHVGEQVNKETGDTALHEAVNLNRLDLVQELLQPIPGGNDGVDGVTSAEPGERKHMGMSGHVNTPNHDGKTPLQMAYVKKLENPDDAEASAIYDALRPHLRVAVVVNSKKPNKADGNLNWECVEMAAPCQDNPRGHMPVHQQITEIKSKQGANDGGGAAAGSRNPLFKLINSILSFFGFKWGRQANFMGDTPFHIIAEDYCNGAQPLYDWLLKDEHVSLNCKNYEGETPVSLAIKSETMPEDQKIALLKSQRCDLKQKILGQSLLQVAVATGRKSEVELVIDVLKNAGSGLLTEMLLTADRNGNTPLHNTLETHDSAIFDLLIGEINNCGCFDKVLAITNAQQCSVVHLAINTKDSHFYAPILQTANQLKPSMVLKKAYNLSAEINSDVQSPIQLAFSCDTQDAALLLLKGEVINIGHEHEKLRHTYLHLSVRKKWTKVTDHILGSEAVAAQSEVDGRTVSYINLKDENDKSALDLAAENTRGGSASVDDYSTVRKLLGQGAMPDPSLTATQTPLSCIIEAERLLTAAGGKYNARLNFLCQSDAHLQAVKQILNTCQKLSTEAGQQLLEKINNTMMSDTGNTALMNTATTLQFDLQRYFNDKRNNGINQLFADQTANKVLARRDENGRTALHIAVRHAPETALHLLKNYNFNFTEADKDNKTVLHLAAERGDIRIVSAILKKMTPKDFSDFLNKVDNEGNTAFHICCQKGYHLCATIIFDKCSKTHRADLLRKTNSDNNTPLHCACQCGDCDTIDFLLKRRECSITAVNDKMQTPLHTLIARQNATVPIIKMFAVNKSFTEALMMRDSQQHSPLELEILANKEETSADVSVFSTLLALMAQTQSDEQSVTTHLCILFTHACENVRNFTRQINLLLAIMRLEVVEHERQKEIKKYRSFWNKLRNITKRPSERFTQSAIYSRDLVTAEDRLTRSDYHMPNKVTEIHEHMAERLVISQNFEETAVGSFICYSLKGDPEKRISRPKLTPISEAYVEMDEESRKDWEQWINISYTFSEYDVLPAETTTSANISAASKAATAAIDITSGKPVADVAPDVIAPLTPATRKADSGKSAAGTATRAAVKRQTAEVKNRDTERTDFTKTGLSDGRRRYSGDDSFTAKTGEDTSHPAGMTASTPKTTASVRIPSTPGAAAPAGSRAWKNSTGWSADKNSSGQYSSLKERLLMEEEEEQKSELKRRHTFDSISEEDQYDSSLSDDDENSMSRPLWQTGRGPGMIRQDSGIGLNEFYQHKASDFYLEDDLTHPVEDDSAIDVRANDDEPLEPIVIANGDNNDADHEDEDIFSEMEHINRETPTILSTSVNVNTTSAAAPDDSVNKMKTRVSPTASDEPRTAGNTKDLSNEQVFEQETKPDTSAWTSFDPKNGPLASSSYIDPASEHYDKAAIDGSNIDLSKVATSITVPESVKQGWLTDTLNRNLKANDELLFDGQSRRVMPETAGKDQVKPKPRHYFALTLNTPHPAAERTVNNGDTESDGTMNMLHSMVKGKHWLALSSLLNLKKSQHPDIDIEEQLNKALRMKNNAQMTPADLAFKNDNFNLRKLRNLSTDPDMANNLTPTALLADAT